MRERLPPWSLFLVVTLFGAFLVITMRTSATARVSAEPRRAAIVQQILSQRQAVNDREQALDTLENRLRDAQRAASTLSQSDKERVNRLQDLRSQSGMTDVRGDGLVVKLTDASSLRQKDASGFGAARVQDNDLQQVVNALLASGARAVALNDNRVTSLSSIRAAGGTILVNYRPTSSPYRVVGIGARKDAFTQSDIARNFTQWRAKYDMGFSVDEEKNLSAPRFLARTQGGFAQVGSG